MFDELVESSVVKKEDEHGLGGHSLDASFRFAVLLVLILIPLIYTQALPKAMLATLLDCATASAAASATSSGGGSEGHQAGGPADPARQADAAARDSEGGRGLQGSGLAAGTACNRWRRASAAVDQGLLGGLGRRARGSGTAAASSEADAANQARRTGVGGEASRAAAARLSASRAAGPHSGQRCAACHHR